MPVGDESRVRKGLEGKESSRRRDKRESNWYGEGPEVGIVKKLTEVLVNTANPLGRIRGETPNREWDKADAGRK
jgi:hypothetical protein